MYPNYHYSPVRRHEYYHAHRCHGCGRCGNFNAYRFPRPIGKVQRLLDATGIRVHTDKFVGESCVHRDGCCEPVKVKVEEKIKSFIIKAATECLEPNVYYTLHTNHPLPDGIFALPTFIQVEKCGLFKDPVNLIFTETVFPMCEFDGFPKCGVPADPAFPDGGLDVIEGNGLVINDGFRDEGFREGEGGLPLHRPEFFKKRKEMESRLIPVELDLHGNTAFGINFAKGISPHAKTIQLYYTNRGTFSLVRPYYGENRKTDF